MTNTSDKDAFFNLTDAVDNLIDSVLSYESDTFSASESEIDKETAVMMSAWLIRTFLFDEGGMPGDCIDGAVIGLAFDNVTVYLEDRLNLPPESELHKNEQLKGLVQRLDVSDRIELGSTLSLYIARQGKRDGETFSKCAKAYSSAPSDSVIAVLKWLDENPDHRVSIHKLAIELIQSTIDE